jgi:hypothetical protein
MEGTARSTPEVPINEGLDQGVQGNPELSKLGKRFRGMFVRRQGTHQAPPVKLRLFLPHLRPGNKQSPLRLSETAL